MDDDNKWILENEDRVVWPVVVTTEMNLGVP
jgi:hypothetical protein